MKTAIQIIKTIQPVVLSSPVLIALAGGAMIFQWHLLAVAFAFAAGAYVRLGKGKR